MEHRAMSPAANRTGGSSTAAGGDWSLAARNTVADTTSKHAQAAARVTSLLRCTSVMARPKITA
jgi:hypothetical protein